MLNIAIWGAGKNGRECFDRLKKYIYGMSDIFFVDINPEKVGIKWCGCPVYEIFELVKRKDTVNSLLVFVAVPEDFFVDIEKKIKEFQLTEKVVYYTKSGFTPVDVLVKKAGMPVLPYVETHVHDGCNLRCRGCGHLSNIAPSREAEFDGFYSDLKRLKELFSGITKIRLMGGEPFLNNHLYEYVRSARNIWQNTDIAVVTNGLLLNQDKLPLLREISKLGAHLEISAYPVTLSKKNEIEEIIREAGIDYRFTEPIKEFMRFRSKKGENNCGDAYAVCPIKQCHFLRNGMLSNCSFPIIYTQLDTFMKNVFEFVEEDYVYLYEEEINGWDVINRIEFPIKACRYCESARVQFFPWEGNYGSDKAKEEDWMIGENV